MRRREHAVLSGKRGVNQQHHRRDLVRRHPAIASHALQLCGHAGFQRLAGGRRCRSRRFVGHHNRGHRAHVRIAVNANLRKDKRAVAQGDDVSNTIHVHTLAHTHTHTHARAHTHTRAPARPTWRWRRATRATATPRTRLGTALSRLKVGPQTRSAGSRLQGRCGRRY